MQIALALYPKFTMLDIVEAARATLADTLSDESVLRVTGGVR